MYMFKLEKCVGSVHAEDIYMSRWLSERIRDKKFVLTAHGFMLLLKSSRKGHLYAKMIIGLKQIRGKKISFNSCTSHSFMLLLKKSRNAD